MNLVGRLCSKSALLRYLWFTVSNAFLKSTHTRNPFSSWSISFCITSWILFGPSRMCLPLMKAVCSLRLIEGNTRSILLARALVRLFCDLFIRDIGRQFLFYKSRISSCSETFLLSVCFLGCRGIRGKPPIVIHSYIPDCYTCTAKITVIHLFTCVARSLQLKILFPRLVYTERLRD